MNGTHPRKLGVMQTSTRKRLVTFELAMIMFLRLKTTDRYRKAGNLR